ncbi:plastocyanin/azurin family copper-binding protein [Haladaptatus sp. AB618]|uniref:plastocyanin/azurin family copper-binding protein n=1 Tax=Haladaptatus sp. AB618 TaxID=2934173 RepID=UPI00209C3C3A|nr:plastocyanin/azurin family copper-binding protein [Haladaptatus sp. AB618]MCO8254336.1 plastocyanin/azurin family copper-binding protein [Haladaptatus sp. AB618]
MSRQQTRTQTRRAFLTTMAAGTVAAASSGTADAQGTKTIKLGGEVMGWQGQQPSSISGKKNPTLKLKAGQKYEVIWTNLDGQPHNFQLLDSSGNVIKGTDRMSQKGATQSLTFTATPEMVKYRCQVHPTTMVGKVQIPGAKKEATSSNANIPADAYVFAAAIILAVFSPLLFALLLMRVGTDDGMRPSG